MCAPSSLSPSFLADLTEAYAALQPQLLLAAFLSELEQVYASLCPASGVNLHFLAEHFDKWRERTRDLLRSRLKDLPTDDPLLCPISLFRTMDYGRLETAPTRTLAWLLDSTREHGFGDKLLAALLQRILNRGDFDKFSAERVTSEQSVAGLDAKGRLDVLAEGTWEDHGKRVRWLLVIEAKVSAMESEAQLTKYEQWLRSYAAGRQVLRVFLTPDGRTAESGSDAWEPLSYLQLVQAFRKVYGELRDAPGFHFLRFYLAGVLQDICGWPHIVPENAADPYAVTSYLKTVAESLHKGKHNDPAR
jgi:hypothetical protein